MSQPNEVTLFATRGDDSAWEITFENDDTANFTEIWLTIKRTWAASTETDDANAVVQLKLSTGGIVRLDATTARADLTSAQALLLTDDRYVHDVQVLRSGKRYTTQRGPLRVKADVTRS